MNEKGKIISIPTKIELIALQHAADGLTYRESALREGIAAATIRGRLVRAREKLDARSTTHAVAICLRNGWIE